MKTEGIEREVAHLTANQAIRNSIRFDSDSFLQTNKTEISRRVKKLVRRMFDLGTITEDQIPAQEEAAQTWTDEDFEQISSVLDGFERIQECIDNIQTCTKGKD